MPSNTRRKRGSAATRRRLYSPDEQYRQGKALREKCPRDSHAQWKAPHDRRETVALVLAAAKGRLPDLLPLRHGRMVRSPFTFYRGAALTMAADLATTPTSGIRVQCCGDAHLCNFGGFATPERRVIFSINDLDETLPAPWEWDLKRLAASVVVACRDNQLSESVAMDVTTTCVRRYRESMLEFSELRTLELWYQAMRAEDLLDELPSNLRKRVQKRIEQEASKSRAEEIFPKLVENNGGKPYIRDSLPTIFHHQDAPPGVVRPVQRDAVATYRSTLHSAHQALFDRYELHDVAIKVVGIGSVGTRCWVFLFMASEGDPLFLQVKEARASVFEPFAGASRFANHGERVVNGYRLLQPSSDMFLGWSEAPGHHYFLRQLRDIKIRPLVDSFGRTEMTFYASWCGRALALSHARSGSSALLAGYMGKSDVLDDAIGRFAKAYADQNEKDHAALARAVKKGQVKAVFEEKE